MSDAFLTEGHSKGRSGVSTQACAAGPTAGPGPCASSALLIAAALLLEVAI